MRISITSIEVYLLEAFPLVLIHDEFLTAHMNTGPPLVLAWTVLSWPPLAASI